MNERICSADGCGSPYYSMGLCKPCYRRDYRARNRARETESWAAWYAKNRTPEYLNRKKTDAMAYYYANRELIREVARAARAANIAAESKAGRNARLAARRARYAVRVDHYRLKAIDYTQRRNARKAGCAVSAADYRAILAEHGMVCHICGGEIATPKDLHFDHVIPLARGGEHSADNIRPSHAFCNLQKGAKIA